MNSQFLPHLVEKRRYEHRIVTYGNGRYDGTFCNGEKHGRGRYEFNNGDVYVGDYVDGKR